MPHRVLVTIPAELRFLEGIVDVVRGPIGTAPDATAVLLGPTQRFGSADLESMPYLEVVAVAGSGTDAVDAAALEARGIDLVCAPDATVGSTAELTLALMLMVSRGIPSAISELESGEWIGWSFDHLVGRGLAGLTLGLVGHGRIGRRVARLASAFEMSVIFHTRTARAEPGYRANLNELLSESDIVSLHLPLTDRTRGLVDADSIAAMREGAALVNTSRGGIVDETAVLEALRSGHLSGAAFDVFAAEPLTPIELLGVENLIVTPHIGTSTRGARDAMAREAATNLVEALNARSPGVTTA